MAFPTDPARSIQYRAQEGIDNNDKVDYRKLSPVMRMLEVNYVHGASDVNDVAGVGEIDLIILPVEGMDIKFYPHLSLLGYSQFAAGALLSIGHRAYRQFDGTLVPEDPDFFFLDVAAGAGAQDPPEVWTNVTGVQVGNAPVTIQIGGPGLEKFYRDQRETMLRLFATVGTGNIEPGDTIDMWIAVSYGH